MDIEYIVRARSGWMRGKYLEGFRNGSFRWTKARNRARRFDSLRDAADFCCMVACNINIVRR